MEQYPEWVPSLAGSFNNDLERVIQGHVDVLKDYVGSPIELQFVTALWTGLRVNGLDAVLVRDGREQAKYDLVCKEHDFAISLQYPWRKYRSDLCLGGRKTKQRILVECDGHNFHERTKEQAAHDRRKDMLAQQDGYHIIRFTGSQIYGDPYRCSAELFWFAADMFLAEKASA